MKISLKDFASDVNQFQGNILFSENNILLWSGVKWEYCQNCKIENVLRLKHILYFFVSDFCITSNSDLLRIACLELPFRIPKKALWRTS